MNGNTMQTLWQRILLAGALALVLNGCSDGSDGGVSGPANPPLPPDPDSVFAVANGCYVISVGDGSSFLAPPRAMSPAEAGMESGALAPEAQADRFRLRPSDLGKYLLYTHD